MNNINESFNNISNSNININKQLDKPIPKFLTPNIREKYIKTFVGRKDALKYIEENLKEDKPLLIKGIGGIGL